MDGNIVWFEWLNPKDETVDQNVDTIFLTRQQPGATGQLEFVRVERPFKQDNVVVSRENCGTFEQVCLEEESCLSL